MRGEVESETGRKREEEETKKKRGKPAKRNVIRDRRGGYASC